MSKTVPLYTDSRRLGSPASALHAAPRCLTTSQAVLHVHGVFTTRVTTPAPAVSTQPTGQDTRPMPGILAQVGDIGSTDLIDAQSVK
jgi:hypothetical protein